MSATACCTSKPIIYQIQVITTRSQYTPIVPRSTLSPSSSSSSIISISELHTPIKLNRAIRSDVNNNNNNHHHQITTTAYQESSNISNDNETVDTIDEEQFLAFVGLRHKRQKKSVRILTVRPLAKRLAAPICLLPLPKYSERVRQALYILLPFLKFLSITHDFEEYCSTDDTAKAESLLQRSTMQTRLPKTKQTKLNKRKVSKSGNAFIDAARLTYSHAHRHDKGLVSEFLLSMVSEKFELILSLSTEFVTMAANTFRNNTQRTPMAKYIHSTIQCQVVLDRLDQSTIDQIMMNSTTDNQKQITSVVRILLSISSLDIILGQSQSQNQRSSRHQPSSSKTACLANQTTTQTTTTTTMTTEKTTIKHKSMTTTSSFNDSKRFKASHDDQSVISYQRIYLKCFVCSKRQYIDAQATNSDILHSHWREHGHDLLLNIYDSELDSILTRIVEFFHFPPRHTLEGKIQTVFILNSKEICRKSAKPVDDDNCIVLD